MTIRGTAVEINRALLRPILFCGAERKSTIIYGTLSLVVAASSNFKTPGIYIGPLIFIICHLFFVYLAKKDPQMIALYIRHIKYKQSFYGARGSAAVNPELIQIRPTVEKKR
ncbi:MAG: VirB3 family type IV secretion system protein [Lentisphaerota bacterium]